jgi:L-alanine-DL-glutamate epimerase-like enolase superfamily enzyme
MKLFYTTQELAFHHPFTISNGRTKSVQPTLIVALQLGNYVGFGEAPAITYYNVSIESMIQDIQLKQAHIEKFALTEPERYWHYLHHLLPKNPFLVAALDIACWDLFGNIKNKLLHELWNTNWDNLPLTNLTIGIDSLEKMVAKMKEAPAPIYKIKLGTPDDIAIVTELRKHTDAAFRVDVNGAWTLEEALEKIPQLQKLGVELIEQPLAKDNWEGMTKQQRRYW